MLHSVTSDLCLHCLPVTLWGFPIKMSYGSIWPTEVLKKKKKTAKYMYKMYTSGLIDLMFRVLNMELGDCMFESLLQPGNFHSVNINKTIFSVL